MWLRFRCTLCGGGIKIGEELAGRKVRCPLCLCATDVPATPATIRMVPAGAEIAAATKPGTEPGIALLGSASAVATLPEPKKRKKKKRTVRQGVGDEPEGMDEWLKGLIILGATVGVLLLAAVIGVLAGHGAGVFYCIVMSIVLLPPNLIAVAISLAGASALSGGINFGDIRAAVAKTTALVLVVDLIYLVPYFGGLLAVPVWLIGIMALFRLDGFEIGMVWLVNCVLSRVFLIAAMAWVGPMMVKEGKTDMELHRDEAGQMHLANPNAGDDSER
jgi:hypothetical protein